jgi:hypothetical protein
VSINLRATPSFEALGRTFEAVDPFMLCARAVRLMWMPWLLTVQTMMLQGSSAADGAKGHQLSAKDTKDLASVMRSRPRPSRSFFIGLGNYHFGRKNRGRCRRERTIGTPLSLAPHGLGRHGIRILAFLSMLFTGAQRLAVPSEAHPVMAAQQRSSKEKDSPRLVRRGLPDHRVGYIRQYR